MFEITNQNEFEKSEFKDLAELKNLQIYPEEQVEAFLKAFRNLVEKSEVEELTKEEEIQLKIFKAEAETLKKVIVVNDDLSKEAVFYREKADIEKADKIKSELEEELEGEEGEENEEEEENEEKEKELEKSKYFKREGSPGNYKYYYTEEEYKKAKGVKDESKATKEKNKFLNEYGVHKGFLSLAAKEGWSRKPYGLLEDSVRDKISVSTEAEKDYISSLKTYTSNKGEVPNNNPRSTKKDYLLKDKKTDKTYLVRTEGATYPRYMAIIDSTFVEK